MIETADLDRPGIRRTHAEDLVDERRLARAVRTDEAVDGAVRHREIDRAEGETREVFCMWWTIRGGSACRFGSTQR